MVPRTDKPVTHVAVQTDESEVEAKYKKRIEELEARVAELEAKDPKS
jgi:BMFP domain-containing protein YqiC